MIGHEWRNAYENATKRHLFIKRIQVTKRSEDDYFVRVEGSSEQLGLEIDGYEDYFIHPDMRVFLFLTDDHRENSFEEEYIAEILDGSFSTC